MSDTECPYCGADIEICHDDGYGYEENDVYEQECGKCGKTFAYTTTISLDYWPQKAPCLNGAEHVFEPVRCIPRIYPDWQRCRDCGEENKGRMISLEEAGVGAGE